MRVRGCAMIVRDGKLLVLAYDYPKGRIYAIPGGGVKEGESLADSVVREYEEELGIKVSIGELCFVGDMMAQGPIKQTVHLVFEGRILSGEPNLNHEETSAVEMLWLDLDQLDQVQLYPAVNDAIVNDIRGRGTYLGNCMRREWA